VVDYVRKNPQFNIKTLLQNVVLLFGVGITKQTIYNVISKNNLTRKIVQVNKYPHGITRYESDKSRLQNDLKFRKERIISIDETAIQLNKVGNYGWSPKNERCIINKAHKNKGVRYSLLFGVSKKRIVGYEIKEGTIKADDFVSFMKRIDVIGGRYKYLVDNAVIHHSKKIDTNIKKKLIYNMAYSPQYNPIEYVNNELKRQIKTEKIENVNALKRFMDKFKKKNDKKGYRRYFEKSYKQLEI
jgi:hypothetical protein